jgi:hypothetical protein
MNYQNLKLSVLSLTIATMLIGCGKKQQGGGDDAVTTMAVNLKTVEQDYVPESITDTGAGVGTAVVASKTSDDDICKGVDFIECQPRLIRAYLQLGKGAVSFTHQIVNKVAYDLRGAADNSSGTVTIAEENLTIEYIKKSYDEFDFLVIKDSKPVGLVSAKPESYALQFDIGLLEKDKSDSRGGKMDIKVNYADKNNWSSEITITDLKCNVNKPEDPEKIRLHVGKQGNLWSGQSMFYNGTAAAFGVTRTCDTVATDDTALVIYTDFVANRVAAKAAMYLMKRTEVSTALIENFGLNGFCTQYADLCASLAAAISSTPSAVATHLGSLENPYCMQRGSAQVLFNNSCQALSPEVSAANFLANDSWLSPAEFHALSVSIPEHL